MAVSRHTSVCPLSPAPLQLSISGRAALSKVPLRRPLLVPVQMEQKGPVRRTQQAVGARNHIKPVVGLLLVGMVYQQEAWEITKEEYDRWRYHYPAFDITQRWTKALYIEIK